MSVFKNQLMEHDLGTKIQNHIFSTSLIILLYFDVETAETYKSDPIPISYIKHRIFKIKRHNLLYIINYTYNLFQKHCM